MKNFYIKQGESQFGPLNQKDLRNEMLFEDSMIWHSNWKYWKPAGEIDFLAPHIYIRAIDIESGSSDQLNQLPLNHKSKEKQLHQYKKIIIFFSIVLVSIHFLIFQNLAKIISLALSLPITSIVWLYMKKYFIISANKKAARPITLLFFAHVFFSLAVLYAHTTSIINFTSYTNPLKELFTTSFILVFSFISGSILTFISAMIIIFQKNIILNNLKLIAIIAIPIFPIYYGKIMLFYLGYANEIKSIFSIQSEIIQFGMIEISIFMTPYLLLIKGFLEKNQHQKSFFH